MTCSLFVHYCHTRSNFGISAILEILQSCKVDHELALFSGQVRTGQVRTGQLQTGQLGTGQIGTGQLRTSQVRTGQDETVQVRAGHPKRVI